MSETLTRRSVVITAVSAASYRRISGANDRASVAVVGLGGRGRALLGEWLRIPGVRLAALCDVDQAAVERATALAEQTSGERPRSYSDLRRLFAEQTLDAVTLSLPNHWHALATIRACQAGKDVYVEKPASYCIAESREMTAAAAKYQRIVQVGLQSRSTPHKIRAVELVRQGAGPASDGSPTGR